MDDNMPTQFVTIATHSERYFPILKESANRNGINLTVLGWGQEYTGHYMKDDIMLKYLESLPADENPLIVFIDGFDSIILSNAEEFDRKWEQHQRDTSKRLNDNTHSIPEVLVSRDFDPEWLARPFFSYNYSRVFSKCSDMYINAGQFMGKKSALIEFLQLAKHYRDPKISSNQLVWALTYRDNRKDPIFLIDSQSDIFLNYCLTNTLEGLDITVDSSTRRVHLGITGTQPCVISGPGSSDLDDIAKKLGYTVENPQTNAIRWYSYLRKIPYYINLFYPELVIITGATMVVSAYIFNRL